MCEGGNLHRENCPQPDIGRILSAFPSLLEQPPDVLGSNGSGKCFPPPGLLFVVPFILLFLERIYSIHNNPFCKIQIVDRKYLMRYNYLFGNN